MMMLVAAAWQYLALLSYTEVSCLQQLPGSMDAWTDTVCLA